MASTRDFSSKATIKIFLIFTIGFNLSLCFMTDSTFGASTFDCNPIEVLELNNRIHVKCAEGAHINPGRGGDGITIHFFAVNKRDKDKANRFASMATAALVTGSAFRVGYEPYLNQEANVAGCKNDDCRTAVFFGIKK